MASNRRGHARAVEGQQWRRGTGMAEVEEREGGGEEL